MKRQRNIQQIRDHGKNPQDQINEDEISSIAEKIQSDDSKDDPKSYKQNGGRDKQTRGTKQEVMRNVNKDLKELKH